MRRAQRLGGLAALAVAVAAAGACGRLGRRSGAPPDARAVPSDSARAAAAVPDSARRADSARLARADSVARDTVPTAADSARADTARVAPARPRRREIDPASRCREVDFTDSPATARLQSITDPTTGRHVTFVGGGVVARCTGVNNTLRADSAEHYETAGFLLLIGNVAYDEPRRVRMTSQRLTYFTAEERLLAEGEVRVVLPTGSTMTGPTAEYLRAVPAIRERSRLTATGRPTLQLVEQRTRTPSPAAGGAPAPISPAPSARPDTATVTANTIVDEGDSLVFAAGAVQILRTDVIATSDSAHLDQGAETARLIKNATIRGRTGRAFTLSGVVVDLFSRERSLTRVLAKDSARIVSEDLNLRSDTVDLRLAEGRVERAFAWGPSRATATSPDREIVADSIDALLPLQRIRELRALRGAVARSAPDSTRVRSTERDQLRGDTVLARFDSAAAAQDTTRNPPIRQLVSAGNASALYQIATSEGREAPPAINYVRGRVITVDFDSNQVQTVTVVDSADGIYLDPSADSTSDSTSDSTARGRGGRARRAAPTPPAVRPGTPTRRPDDGSPPAAESRAASAPNDSRAPADERLATTRRRVRSRDRLVERAPS